LSLSSFVRLESKQNNADIKKLKNNLKQSNSNNIKMSFSFFTRLKYLLRFQKNNDILFILLRKCCLRIEYFTKTKKHLVGVNQSKRLFLLNSCFFLLFCYNNLILYFCSFPLSFFFFFENLFLFDTSSIRTW